MAHKFQLTKLSIFSNLSTIPQKYFSDIHHAIVTLSFSANIVPITLEAKIVQGADHLDSLSAIAIVRTIVTGVSFDAQLYHPDDPFAEYRERDDKSFSIDHFTVKLFKLVDTLNIDSAMRESKLSTQHIYDFLSQLKTEI